jgi:hypothetical protein
VRFFFIILVVLSCLLLVVMILYSYSQTAATQTALQQLGFHRVTKFSTKQARRQAEERERDYKN